MSDADAPDAHLPASPNAQGARQRLPDPLIVVFRVLAVAVALVLAGANLFGNVATAAAAR